MASSDVSDSVVKRAIRSVSVLGQPEGGSTTRTVSSTSYVVDGERSGRAMVAIVLETAVNFAGMFSVRPLSGTSRTARIMLTAPGSLRIPSGVAKDALTLLSSGATN